MTISLSDTDTSPPEPLDFDSSPGTLPAPADAAAMHSRPVPALCTSGTEAKPTDAPAEDHPPPHRCPIVVSRHGSVLLNADVLRDLRNARLLSQQSLVDDFYERNIQVSIATIKRVETWHPVRFRIAHTLARYYGVAIDRLLH